MFSWVHQKSDGTLIEITASDLVKLSASKYAWNRCVDIIASSVAKSEVLVSGGNKSASDNLYYLLNVKPNPNETATEFWKKTVQKLLTDGEALIVPIQSHFYRAENWQADDSVTKAKKYTNVTITSGESEMTLVRKFSADEVVHIRFANERIKTCWNALMGQYDALIDSANAMAKMSYTPKFKLKMNAAGSMGGTRLLDSSTGQTVTKDAYAKKLLDTLNSDRASMITLSEGIDLSQIEITNPVTTTDIVNITNEIDRRTTIAFGIPITVYDGTITEKSDATNELLTYAVMPVVEAINDGLNASLVGYDDFVAGQRITIWTGCFSHKDVVDCADGLDKLRSNGWTLDECRQMVGWPALNTKFSETRYITKNYTNDENGALGINDTGGSK